MQRRRAVTMIVCTVSAASFALLAGCQQALPPECTPRMTKEECAEAVAWAAGERAAKAAAEEAERVGKAAMEEAQRQGERAVASGRSWLEERWNDLWKPAEKPSAQGPPQKGPAVVPKAEAPTALQIVRQPVPFEKVTWFNPYGATTLAHGKLRGAYGELQGFHSGLDFLVEPETPITSCVNLTGKVISVSNEPFPYKTGPHNVVVRYDHHLVLYGHVSANERPSVGDMIGPGDRVGKSGEDDWGVKHLHLEILLIAPDVTNLPCKPPADSRPAIVRTNPLPFFSPALRQQLDTAMLDKRDTMYLPEDHEWHSPDNQPNIVPGCPSLWNQV